MIGCSVVLSRHPVVVSVVVGLRLLIAIEMSVEMPLAEMYAPTPQAVFDWGIKNKGGKLRSNNIENLNVHHSSESALSTDDYVILEFDLVFLILHCSATLVFSIY